MTEEMGTVVKRKGMLDSSSKREFYELPPPQRILIRMLYVCASRRGIYERSEIALKYLIKNSWTR